MSSKPKRLAILGSTGSIGRQTLDVVRNQAHRFDVVALAARQNVDLLSQQIKEFRPRYVYHSAEKPLYNTVNNYDILSLEEIASHEQVDTVVVATSGKSGLLATLAAARTGKTIALANKESLVMAGDIITREAKNSGARIMPVDSEHSAIWQCLQGEEAQSCKRIILTASGGPFRNYTVEQLEQVTAEQALKHPSWQMGPKVTIDSATLMNKGLEIIETHWLFNVPFENIDVIIHPQSIIHSMVEFADGSVKAQLGRPDMRLPIQYALTYPERLPNAEIPRIDWNKISSLTFEQPDPDRFPCLKLAVEAGNAGGTSLSVLCAADEVAVDLFLSGAIRFTDIAYLVKQLMAEHPAISQPTIEDIISVDAWARQKTRDMAGGIKPC